MQLTNNVCFAQLTNTKYQTEHGFTEIGICIQKGNRFYTTWRLKKNTNVLFESGVVITKNKTKCYASGSTEHCDAYSGQINHINKREMKKCFYIRLTWYAYTNENCEVFKSFLDDCLNTKSNHSAQVEWGTSLIASIFEQTIVFFLWQFGLSINSK